MTCLRSTAVTGAFFRDFPQQPHFAGRCRTFLPGCSDSSIVAPGWPFGLPGLRPDLPRSDFGDGLAGPSDDGGLLSSGSSPSPGRPGPRPATAAPSPARAAPRSPRPAPRSGRPARPAAPAAACSQHEARHHRCRERRASRARTNAATTPPGPQIGRHRSGLSRRENPGDERKDQTDLSSYACSKKVVNFVAANIEHLGHLFHCECLRFDHHLLATSRGDWRLRAPAFIMTLKVSHSGGHFLSVEVCYAMILW